MWSDLGPKPVESVFLEVVSSRKAFSTSVLVGNWVRLAKSVNIAIIQIHTVNHSNWLHLLDYLFDVT